MAIKNKKRANFQVLSEAKKHFLKVADEQKLSGPNLSETLIRFTNKLKELLEENEKLKSDLADCQET